MQHPWQCSQYTYPQQRKNPTSLLSAPTAAAPLLYPPSVSTSCLLTLSHQQPATMHAALNSRLWPLGPFKQLIGRALARGASSAGAYCTQRHVAGSAQLTARRTLAPHSPRRTLQCHQPSPAQPVKSHGNEAGSRGGEEGAGAGQGLHCALAGHHRHHGGPREAWAAAWQPAGELRAPPWTTLSRTAAPCPAPGLPALAAPRRP